MGYETFFHLYFSTTLPFFELTISSDVFAVLRHSFPANRGLSGGEKIREGDRPLPAPGKFFDLPSSTILDETKLVLKYRFFVTLVTHLLRMSRFIGCWMHCEPTLQNRKPNCRGHVSRDLNVIRCHETPAHAR